jgi:hypothetical protein
VRVTPGLAGMIDQQDGAVGYQEQVVSAAESGGNAARKNVGRGRVAYLPKLEFDGALPPHQQYFPIGKEFWKRPKNWKDLVELVSWAAEDKVPIRINAPRGVVINYTSQHSMQRAFIHVVNYDRSSAAANAIEIDARLPDNRQTVRITAHTPGSKTAQAINFEKRGDLTRFALSTTQPYCVVMIEW